jgi:hypothetical protein
VGTGLVRRVCLVAEFDRLISRVRLGWQAGRIPWLGIILACGVPAVYLLLHAPGFGRAVWHSGAVYASLPLGTELWRLPMSFFLPTPYLPVWAAMAQVLVVVGLGEIVFGRWLTIVVAATGHFAATLTTRMVLEAGQGTVFALPHALVHSLDTGPSAAATAVGACMLLGLRMHRLTAVLCVALIAAAAVAPGVDGQEHLAALVLGLVGGGAYRLSRGRSLSWVGLWRPMRTDWE